MLIQKHVIEPLIKQLLSPKNAFLFRSCFILVCLLPILILGIFSFVKVYNAETESVFQQKKSNAFLFAGIIHEELTTAMNVGISLATRYLMIDEIEKGEWTKAIGYLKGTLKNFPIYERIILYSPDGIIRADMPSVTPSVIGTSRANMQWYQDVKKDWMPYVSGIYQRGAQPKMNVVSLIIPIRSNPDSASMRKPLDSSLQRVVGILQLQINLNIFQEWIKGANLGEEGLIYIVDQNGNIVYHPEIDFRKHVVSFINVPAVAQLLKEKSGAGIFYNHIEKENRVSAFHPVKPFKWGVVVAQPLSEAFKARDQHMTSLGIIFSIMLILSLTAIILFLLMIENRRKFEEDMIKINEELKKGSFNIEESRRFLSNILDALGDPVFVKDRKHRWVLLNDSFCALLGRKKEELLGKSDYDFFPKEEADVFWQKDELVFKTRETNVNEEFFTDQKGIRHTILTKKVHYVASNGAEHIVGIITDISRMKRVMEDLKQSKNELEEAKQFLDSIIENIPNMIFVKDAKELRFVRLNKAGEELIGISREEMIGKNDYDLFPKEEADFFTNKDRETLKSKFTDIPEEKIHTKKGERALHTKKVTIVDDKGKPKYLLGISEDVTEIKLAESKLKESVEAIRKTRDQLDKASQELQRSNEDLEQFAYVASHDLQEPLRMVASYCQLLEKHYKGKLDEQGLKYLHYAVDGAKRMQGLVDDLLAFARVGKNDAERTNVNLNEVLKMVLHDLSFVIQKEQASVEVQELPTIKANRNQMAQLFQNFLTNALKFKGQQKPIIQVMCEKKDTCWEFRISDNGIGIEKQYFEKIFVIFQRLHSKNTYAGTGIGLALCKKIIESYGGKIWVKSEVGQGTTFYFTIPF